jgi:uncharacterized protein (DUF1697 family)
MAIFISILRGINVSGQKIIKMDALRKSYESLGLENVITYVQSGNIIFSSEQDDTDHLAEKITCRIKDDFSFDVPVIVMKKETMKQIIDGNPFAGDPDKDPSYMYVTFLESAPVAFDKKIIEDKKQGDEEIAFSESAVYFYCPHGYGRTSLNNNFLENKLKVRATTRNWKTTLELLRLAGEFDFTGDI